MLPRASGDLTEESIVDLLRWQPPAADNLELAAANAIPVENLRHAAVLVPLIWDQNQWHLLFTRRTELVHNHKGQVSFPGGAADPVDNTPEETALREAYEEIGLQPDGVRLLGRLVRRPTVTSFLITPVVARITDWPYTFQMSREEVSRVFTIPLSWLADPANREERPRTFPNGYYESIIYFQSYNNEILWGATARITLDLLLALQLTK